MIQSVPVNSNKNSEKVPKILRVEIQIRILLIISTEQETTEKDQKQFQHSAKQSSIKRNSPIFSLRNSPIDHRPKMTKRKN